MRVTVYRYNPESDSVPHLQDYDFELPQSRDLMVLDVLEALKEQDPTLTFRRSCREGVCGSDGMNINGANALACITRVSTALEGGHLPSGQKISASKSLIIRPLPGAETGNVEALFADLLNIEDRERHLRSRALSSLDQI